MSSLPDMAIEEVLEDVRLECARSLRTCIFFFFFFQNLEFLIILTVTNICCIKFLLFCRFGTVKSFNVVRHNSGKNLAINKVDSEEAFEETVCNINVAEPSFSEKATYANSKGTSGTEFCYEKELEEDKVDDGSSVDINAEVFDNKSCQEEQFASDTAVGEASNKTIPSSIIQECPDYQDTPKDGPELHDKMAVGNNDLDIEKKMVGSIADSNDTVSMLQEGSSECDANSESVATKKVIDEKDDIHDNVFEQGSVLVEFGRTEACCSAARCLHGRFFDGRMVTVEYVSLSQYRARFEK